MNYTTFIERLEKCGNLSDERKSLLRGRAAEREVEERIHLLRPGQVCKHMYFIKQGLFRCYSDLDGKEVTTNFMGEGDFMTCMPAFFKNANTKEGLVCEKKAIIITLNYNEWRAMCDDDHDFMEISLNVCIESLATLYEQSHVYRTGNTSQKVEQICSIYPGILNMVAQKHIASYFGVTEQAISMIIANLK